MTKQQKSHWLSAYALRVLYFAVLPLAVAVGLALTVVGTALFIPLAFFAGFAEACPPFELCTGAMVVFRGMRTIQSAAWGKPAQLNHKAKYISRTGNPKLEKLAATGAYEIEDWAAVGLSMATCLFVGMVDGIIVTSHTASAGSKLQAYLMTTVIGIVALAAIWTPFKRNHNRKLGRALMAGDIMERPAIIAQVFREELKGSDLEPETVMQSAEVEIRPLLHLAAMYQYGASYQGKSTYRQDEKIHAALTFHIHPICEDAKAERHFQLEADAYVKQPIVDEQARQRREDFASREDYIDSLIRQLG